MRRWREEELPVHLTREDIGAGWAITVIPEKRRSTVRATGADMMRDLSRGRPAMPMKQVEKKEWLVIAHRAEQPYTLGRQVGRAELLPSGYLRIGSYIEDSFAKLARMVLRLPKEASQ